MKSVVAVFASRKDAARGVERLRSIGMAEDRIDLLTPRSSEDRIHQVPTTDAEPPGVARALGGAVGAAVGTSIGVPLATAAGAFLIPGVGPVIGVGIAAAALLGGVAGGIAVGGKLEELLAQGVPVDELYVYEDALRRGHSVVLARASDADQAGRARELLEKSGAESIDAARDRWWVGLRDAERERYHEPDRFSDHEPAYRAGFEAALRLRQAAKPYPEAQAELRRRHGADAEQAAFRAGYERGRDHLGELAKRG